MIDRQKANYTHKLMCYRADTPLKSEYIDQEQLFSHRKRLLFFYADKQKGATNHDKTERENQKGKPRKQKMHSLCGRLNLPYPQN